jgi:hypothetical protein
MRIGVSHADLPRLFTGRKMTDAELEAQARKLANGGKDEEVPLEWGTGLKQKADAQDAQARLRAAIREVPFVVIVDLDWIVNSAWPDERSCV